MKVFFWQEYSYQLALTQEQVEKKLRYITNRRFEDYSVDLVGSLDSNGKFELMNKWGLTDVEWLGNRRAYLQGRIVSDEQGTRLHVSLRPNLVLILVFYVSLALLICELTGVSLIPFFSAATKIFCLSILNVLLLATMFYSLTRLKQRFEALMQLD